MAIAYALVNGPGLHATIWAGRGRVSTPPVLLRGWDCPIFNGNDGVTMKPILPIFVLMVAAMGPAREAPPPRIDAQSAGSGQTLPAPPAEVEPVADPAPRPDLRILPATEADPADFLWNARPVVVFADTPDDPAFREQMQVLEARPDALAERDVVVIVDSDPSANSAWRRQLHPRGFSMVIIDKDGQVKQRRPLPWDVREITRAIDRLPLRRQEIGRAGLMP